MLSETDTTQVAAIGMSQANPLQLRVTVQCDASCCV